MNFITITYNCNWIILIIIPNTLSNTIKHKRRYQLFIIDNERFCNKKGAIKCLSEILDTENHLWRLKIKFIKIKRNNN